ncbi:DUF6193 family natural product biosynthesis protein [Streptomyces sp. SID7909]|uniref:DUF6193 family natural product biosynthesis protein n=1 Tax=Streptomyces sp. SID7909 TaxID=2706092 RepID=UPI0013B8C50C|nr:DUF6193 family natural product biosynthesis protein [Streptomyces sp. SID7909]NEC09660.1 hypothetical protein [Streptomyces sp. SID7909]
MTDPRPDPAALYPEVAAHGSLAAALRAVAAGGLDAVPLSSPDGEPLLDAGAATTLPHRRPLRVSAWRYERRWHISGDDAFQSLPVLGGETDDLAQVARAVRGWHDGEPLEDIHRAAPFARPTGRFEVPDLDPGRLAESEWQGLRQQAAGLPCPWAPAYRSLIEAAYAEPVLRALYPFTSHWALRFSTTTRPLLTVVGPSVAANGEGAFAVSGGPGAAGEFATARAAVAATLVRLPADPGLVALGAPPE